MSNESDVKRIILEWVNKPFHRVGPWDLLVRKVAPMIGFELGQSSQLAVNSVAKALRGSYRPNDWNHTKWEGEVQHIIDLMAFTLEFTLRLKSQEGRLGNDPQSIPAANHGG